MTTRRSEIVARQPRDGAKRIGAAVAYAAAYVAVDLALRPLVSSPSHISPWYPGAGIGIAALVFGDGLAAMLLFAARLVLVYWFSPGGAPSFAVALADTAGSIVAYAIGGVIIRRTIPLDDHAWRVRDVVLLLAAIAASAAAAAAWSVVAALLRTGVLISRGDVGLFAAGDAIGALIIVPFILFALRPDRQRARGRMIAEPDVFVGSPDERPVPSAASRRWHWLERGGQAAAIMLAVYTAWLQESAGRPVSGYSWMLCFLPLLWIAQREGLRGASIAVAIYGLACIGIQSMTRVALVDVAATQSLLLALSVCGLTVGAARTASEEGAARYWNLLATASEGIWRLGPDGRTLYANPRMAEILGRKDEDIVGRHAREFIAPEDLDAWTRQREDRAEGRSATYEARLLRADGTRASVVATASPVRSVASGAIVGSVAVVTDVTAMRALESRERTAQEVVQAAFRTARDAMILYREHDERIVDVNDVWCVLTGYRREDVIGRSQRELDLWADARDADRLASAIREHGAARDVEIEIHRRTTNGGREVAHTLFSAHPLVADGTTYVLVVGRDITAQRRADEAQSHLRRLEELGRLAGAVAHDFNNLLTVVLAYAQLIRAATPESNTRVLDDVAEIERTCFRGAEVTKRLLAFTRRRPVNPRPLDFNELVEAATGMLSTIVGKAITVRLDLADELPPVMADPGQVDQVLLNLAVNARDAMADGGELEISTRLVHASPGAVATAIGPDTLPGDYVELAVRDTGIGMDEETQRRAFEPFFTTKPVGEGTGIGLAVVSGIARQARGAVRVRSAPGKGATFSIFWPVAGDATADLETAGSRLSRDREHQGRILIAEDDDRLRELMHTVLSEAGFIVQTARDGARALNCMNDLAAAGAAPDVVVSDLVMPGMSGYELVSRLAERHPGVRVVLMTGHSHWRAPSPVPPNVVGDPIIKPFDTATLRRAIAQARGVRR